MLTEDELNWIRNVLAEEPRGISPSYLNQKETKLEWIKSKEKIRKELDDLRNIMLSFPPHELIELKYKNVRESRSIKNFEGIYIIQNCVKDIYYVGQSESILDRAYTHFVTNPEKMKGRVQLTTDFSLPEIYNDYNSGDEFSVSLIPLHNTSFSSLDELEGAAIIAYNSLVPKGYNRIPGNITNTPIFFNKDFEKAANLIFERIKEKKGGAHFLSISNKRKRIIYTNKLFKELELPHNRHFHRGFRTMIKEFKKANKKIYQ